MLKLKAERVWRGKCPRHPRQSYEDPNKLPASCAVCHAIAAVEAEAAKLILSKWRAETAITEAALARRPR